MHEYSKMQKNLESATVMVPSILNDPGPSSVLPARRLIRCHITEVAGMGVKGGAQSQRHKAWPIVHVQWV